MSDKLAVYGTSFQIKIIAALLSDKLYLQQISDIISPEFFESEANNWIVDTILVYYKEYKVPPTLDVFKTKALEITRDVMKMSIVEALREVMKYTDSEDLSYIKDETLKFCKNQCIKRAILDSVDALKKGDYDAIKLKIDNAMKAGEPVPEGYDYVGSVETRYQEASRDTIPTPWPVVNDIAGGGFAKGELVIVVAGPGAGKSTMLMNLGAQALRSGKTVVYYTLELYENYISQRYDAIITGMATQNLKYHVEDIKRELEKLPGKLIPQYYPTKTASCNTLRAHLNRLILNGEKPDIVIVDYADLLKTSGKGKDSHHLDLENIYEDLRGLAGEFAVPVYTASQAGRVAADSEIVTGEQVAGAYAKIMIGDFVISLSRKVTDKISGTGRFYIIKNRFGPDGLTLPSKIDMSCGRMQIFEETSVQGTETKKTMQSSDDVLRKTLATKFKEINGGGLG
jgi:replicative DNA helicase